MLWENETFAVLPLWIYGANDVMTIVEIFRGLSFDFDRGTGVKIMSLQCFPEGPMGKFSHRRAILITIGAVTPKVTTEWI